MPLTRRRRGTATDRRAEVTQQEVLVRGGDGRLAAAPAAAAGERRRIAGSRAQGREARPRNLGLDLGAELSEHPRLLLHLPLVLGLGLAEE